MSLMLVHIFFPTSLPELSKPSKASKKLTGTNILEITILKSGRTCSELLASAHRRYVDGSEQLILEIVGLLARSGCTVIVFLAICENPFRRPFPRVMLQAAPPVSGRLAASPSQERILVAWIAVLFEVVSCRALPEGRMMGADILQNTQNVYTC